MKIHMRKKVVALAAISTLLSACTTGQKISADTNALQSEVETYSSLGNGGDLLSDPQNLVGPMSASKANAMAANQAAVGRWSTQPYVGSRAIAVTGDERLPPVFYAAFDMSFDDIASNGMVPLDAFAQRLTAITRVPVRIKRDVWDLGVAAISQPQQLPAGVPAPMPSPLAAPGAGAMPSPLPNGYRAITPVPVFASAATGPGSALVDVRPITKRGSQPKLLDVLNFATDQLGVSFSYSDGAVIIERYVSEALELDFGEGKVKSALEFGAKGSGSSGSSNTTSGIKLDQEQTTDMFNSAVGAIREYVSKTPGSTVVATDFGRIMVTTTKETMGRTRDLVRQINSRLNTKILVQFDVYHFANNRQDEKGFDWNVVYRSLSRVLGTTFTSPASVLTSGAGSLGFSIIPGGSSETSQRLGNSSIMLKSFNNLGFNSYVKSYPMLLTNRTWGRIVKTDSDVYISELVPGTTSSATGTAIPGVKQTAITFGDDVAIRASLRDSNRICLTLAAGFGDLLSLEKANFGDSGYYTQQPKTSQSAVQREVCHDPGETIILSGLSRRVATSNTNTLAENLAIGFGGSRAVTTTTENMMIVIRATQF